MPHEHNPTVELAEAVARLAALPSGGDPPPVVLEFFEALGLQPALAARPAGLAAVRAAIAERVPDPALQRSFAAMLFDTVTPTVIRSGTKMNVIPGHGMAEIDVRTLPSTDQSALLALLTDAAGPKVTVEAIHRLPAVEADPGAEIVALMTDALLRADPEGTVLPMMITPGTDAKSLATLGIPTYGFSPVRLAEDMPFLSLFHGHNERLPVSALEFGVPVLLEVVSRFAGAE